jgi:hypothetical protein
VFPALASRPRLGQHPPRIYLLACQYQYKSGLPDALPNLQHHYRMDHHGARLFGAFFLSMTFY